MKQRVLSIISEAVLLLTGSLFLYLAQTTLTSGEAFYRSAGFYPSLLCCLIIIGSAIGIVRDVLEMKKGDGETINLGNMKKLALIMAILIAMVLIWNLFNVFYLSLFLAIAAVMFFFHKTERPLRGRILFALIFSVIFTAIAFAAFSILLQIDF